MAEMVFYGQWFWLEEVYKEYIGAWFSILKGGWFYMYYWLNLFCFFSVHPNYSFFSFFFAYLLKMFSLKILKVIDKFFNIVYATS